MSLGEKFENSACFLSSKDANCIFYILARLQRYVHIDILGPFHILSMETSAESHNRSLSTLTKVESKPYPRLL